MRRFLLPRVAVLVLFLAGCMPPASVAAGLPPAVAQAFRQAGIGPEAVGVHVEELGSGRILAASNPETPFVPASTLKLVTTNAALELLGPAYTWKTRAYADGARDGETLLGDLVIQGGGDPKLVQENFWLFLRRIRAAGIRDIRGDLVLDRGMFEADAYDPAAFDGMPERPYNAGPDALLLNYKSFQFRFIPDPAAGQVRVVMEPPVADYPVAPPRLVQGACGDWRERVQAAFGTGGTFMTGTYAAACGERSWYIHPWRMSSSQYFGAVFRQIWSELGGSFSGTVREGALPPAARLVAEWESPPLAEVIRDINKYSNNVMARQLLLALAAEAGGPPANPRRGAEAIAGWLAAKGIAAPELVVENGSGLSRAARVAPRSLGRMLALAFRSAAMPEFMASLPLVGYDGSMRRRLRGRGVAGQAHIKSGTLDGVRAVAGYVLSASGRRHVVVCMVNHPDAAAAGPAIDALLEWVYERG
ncbi:MAG: D-alanyl-D-alanine carboxypeptidase/D-alanyl-D-alanine endopeptidase [Noviherbaspirillum sp.]